jgi:hypothetical protein
MDSGGLDPILFELFSEPVGTVLGTGKDQYLTPVLRADEMTEEFSFASLIYGVDCLADLVSGAVFSGNLYECWVVQESLG